MSNIVLEMKEINKSFNKNKVLKEVKFEVEKGEVHALMGGNGAGKSTLMKILTGVYRADSGSISIDGKIEEINNPTDANQLGIAMIFQEFSLIPKLSVAQNVFLHREPRKRFGLINDETMIDDCQDILNTLGVDISPEERIENLSVGYWQMTEIAKALSMNAKIIIMDEPTSTLTKNESETLFKIIKKLKQSGITIIYISHRMEEIYRVCDRITVLRNGENVVTKSCHEFPMDEVVNAIIGSKMIKTFEWIERPKIDNRKPLLEVKNIYVNEKVNNVSFTLNEGEIVGIAGLMGSGRSETAKAIFGIDSIKSGEIIIKGKSTKIRSPKDAIKNGIGLVPEDRRIEGLVLMHSVRDNAVLPNLSLYSSNNIVSDKTINKTVENLVKKLNVKTDGINKEIGLLSGGNQQKVVLSKWLTDKTDILILDEPTSGVDIGAKTEIIEIIREVADAGKAVLVISSEMTELLAMSDRVLIMKDGTITDSIDRKNINNEEDIEYAIQNI